MADLRSGLNFLVWILLLFIDILRGVQRMAGRAAAPYALSPSAIVQCWLGPSPWEAQGKAQ